MEEISGALKQTVETVGFEFYPFKIAWYNELVSDVFKFDLPGDTLAYIVISTPHMFEKAFIPYVCRGECTGVRDPIDECINHHLSVFKSKMSHHDIEVIHDYELLPSRRPRVLVQTAGHAAGAAYFYQKKDVINPPWDEKKKIYGVSVHPKYGGWFALRSVVIVKSQLVPDLIQVPPPDILQDDESKIDLLEKFNFHWQDWTFRDVIEPAARYSEQQKLYFATPPKNRQSIIEEIKAQSLVGCTQVSLNGSCDSP